MSAVKTTALRLTLLLLAAVPVAASGEDGARRTLVLRDGQRIELREPWRLDGRRVLYLTPAGTLTAIRASELDLEASERAQPAAASEPPAAAPAPAAPVLVLDATNTRKVAKPEAAGSDDGASAAPAGPARSESLQVESFTSVPGDGAITIYGTVRNRGAAHATGITVTVRLKDEGGAEIANMPGRLVRNDVPAGATTNFQAFFPDVLVYGSVEFELSERKR